MATDAYALRREQRGTLRLRRLRFCGASAILRRRQLQHCCGLSGHEPRHQHDLAAGEFQRIVMDVGVVHIDLAEAATR